VGGRVGVPTLRKPRRVGQPWAGQYATKVGQPPNRRFASDGEHSDEAVESKTSWRS
jgi:hypothetical protein